MPCCAVAFQFAVMPELHAKMAHAQALYDEAKARGWLVISMKDDWKHVFPFEQ